MVSGLWANIQMVSFYTDSQNSTEQNSVLEDTYSHSEHACLIL